MHGKIKLVSDRPPLRYMNAAKAIFISFFEGLAANNDFAVVAHLLSLFPIVPYYRRYGDSLGLVSVERTARRASRAGEG